MQNHVELSAFRYRTGFGTSIFVPTGTGLIGFRTVRHSGISQMYTLHGHTASHGLGSEKRAGIRDTPCTSIHGCCWCYSCCMNSMMLKNRMSMPECRNAGEKVVRHRHFYRQSTSSAKSALRHFGSVRYRWSRISPALPNYDLKYSSQYASC